MAKKVLNAEKIYIQSIENLRKYKKVAKSIKDLYKNALSGDGKSLYVLGYIQRYGYKDIKKNVEQSKNYFLAAYDPLLKEKSDKDPVSTYMIATYYHDGFGNVEQDIDKSLVIFNEAHLLGNEEATKFLHDYYLYIEDFEMASKYEHKVEVSSKIIEKTEEIVTSEKVEIVHDEKGSIIEVPSLPVFENYEELKLPFNQNIDDLNDDLYYDKKIREAKRDNNLVITLINRLEGHYGIEYESYLRLLKKYADGNSIDAAAFVGSYLRRKKTPTVLDVNECYEYLNKARDLGSVNGTFELGLFLIETLTSYRDIKLGFTYVDEAARKGSTEALYFLGKTYSEGKFVLRDLNKAKELYDLASQRGCGPAYYQLALISKENLDEENYQIYVEKAKLYGYSF